MRLTLAGSVEMDEDERVSANYMLLANMRIFETICYPYKNGTLDKKLFDAELMTLKWTVTENQGFRAWWTNNPISLSAEFRAFIDGLIRDAQTETKARP